LCDLADNTIFATPLLSFLLFSVSSVTSWLSDLFYLRISDDKIRHAGDALLDGFIRSGVAETNVLAFVRHARAEVDVREDGDPASFSSRLRNSSSPLRRSACRLRHVRPCIEGAPGILADHARNLVEQSDDQVAA